MSKKKNKKKAQKKQVTPRMRLIIALSVALALVLGGVLTWYFVTKKPPMIVQYNHLMTTKAQQNGNISPQEVIIIHNVDESNPNYVVLEGYVYQVPANVRVSKIQKYYAQELPEKWDLEVVGTATAKYIKGQGLESLYGLSVILIK